jgi:hypothetical protein
MPVINWLEKSSLFFLVILNHYLIQNNQKGHSDNIFIKNIPLVQKV